MSTIDDDADSPRAEADLTLPRSTGLVANRDELLATGETALRDAALTIAEAGIAAGDPALRLRATMHLRGDVLHIDGRAHDLLGGRRVFVIGAGKATYPIAQVLDEVLGARIHDGLIVCKRGQAGRLDHIRMAMADHPIPTADSQAAALATLDLIGQVRADDLVLACFTGGSSALFVLPDEGITLQDKAEANRILLGCGANIIQINAVRKHLSRVKGGRIARALPAGAVLVNLTVSDVVGEQMDCITCPTVPDTSDFAEAQAVADRFALWERLPASIAAHLRRGDAASETVRAEGMAHVDRQDVLLVRTDAACRGAAEAARAAGFAPLILSTLFEGESASLARTLTAIAREVRLSGHPLPAPCALIAGGEGTVLLGDRPGLGGPSQEFAAAAALELAGTTGIIALAVDTDGTDGPTPFAGALADGTTAAAIPDLADALARHDVTPALRAAGHAIRTGHTGTNINDLRIILVARA